MHPINSSTSCLRLASPADLVVVMRYRNRQWIGFGSKATEQVKANKRFVWWRLHRIPSSSHHTIASASWCDVCSIRSGEVENRNTKKFLLINYLTCNMTDYEERPYKLLSCKMEACNQHSRLFRSVCLDSGIINWCLWTVGFTVLVWIGCTSGLVALLPSPLWSNGWSTYSAIYVLLPM